MASARELVIGDEPASWARLGFAPDAEGVVALGGFAVRLARTDAGGGGVRELRIAGLAGEGHDGLPLAPAAARYAPPTAARHPNGASAVDHVVVLTDDRDRTTAALERAGGDVRRRGEPPALPAPMAFVRFGELIVEVARAGGTPRFWGVTITVPDVDALAGPVLGTPRDAVQQGRRIVRRTRREPLGRTRVHHPAVTGSNPLEASRARPASRQTGTCPVASNGR